MPLRRFDSTRAFIFGFTPKMEARLDIRRQVHKSTHPVFHLSRIVAMQDRRNPNTKSSGRLHFSRYRSVALIAIVGVALSVAACSSGGSSTPSTAASTGSSSGATARHDSITIHNFAFAPNTMTVRPGATVTVTNTDQVTHTLTASKNEFTTGDIGPGQSKTFTAPKSPGTYSYFCMIHQYMTGSLVVSS
jgi:plastocyanin